MENSHKTCFEPEIIRLDPPWVAFDGNMPDPGRFENEDFPGFWLTDYGFLRQGMSVYAGRAAANARQGAVRRGARMLAVGIYGRYFSRKEPIQVVGFEGYIHL